MIPIAVAVLQTIIHNEIMEKLTINYVLALIGHQFHLRVYGHIKNIETIYNKFYRKSRFTVIFSKLPLRRRGVMTIRNFLYPIIEKRST